MPNFPLRFQPGIFTDATEKDAVGRWREGERVRFDQKGFPQTIGGWVKDTDNLFTGVCRGMLDWVTLSNITYIALGTSRKLQLWEGGAYTNITPYRDSSFSPFSSAALEDPFSSTAASDEITVTHVSHGIETANTTVTLSNATASPIDGTTVDGAYDVTEVVDADNYKIQIAAAVTTTEANFGSADAVSNGGFGSDTVWTKGTGWSIAAGVASCDGTQVADTDLTQDITSTDGESYEVTYTVSNYTAGNVTAVVGDNEGTDRSANGTYVETIISGAGSDIDIRGDLDFVGDIDDVVVKPLVGFYYEINAGFVDTSTLTGYGTGTYGAETWDTPRTTSSLSQLATVWSLDTWGEDLIACRRDGSIYVWDASVGTTSRASIITNAPITAKSIIVSPTARHLIAMGAHDGTNDDPLLIRWCSSEDYTDWTETAGNTAGRIRLDRGSEIRGSLRTRGQILIGTDVAIHGLIYTGDDFVFGKVEYGEGCGWISPRSAAEQNGVVYWMGEEDFFIFDGALRVLPCDVKSTVFQDINKVQSIKFHASTNRKHNEVWWFYCSENSDEIDRYVSYNYLLGVWAIGALDRTAWVDIGENSSITIPYATDASGYLYQHEIGVDADEAHMNAYLESHDIAISEGQEIIHVKRFIPDFINLDGSADITFKTKKYPSGAEISKQRNITSSTGFQSLRTRGRYTAVRIATTEAGDSFHMGTMVVQGVPSGRR
jgi:hypothetical protein